MSQSDPIRDNYYSKLQIADNANNWLFAIGALLSFAGLFVEQGSWPRAYTIVQVAFSLVAAGLFILGLFSRLYFFPRAENRRRQDFFSHAYKVPLSHEATDGYYNNRQVDPIRRLAAQTLENSLFTKRITLEMARRARCIAAAYLLIWLGCAISQRFDVGIIVAMAQVVLSEQIIARLIRLEWLRSQSEQVFEGLYSLFHTAPTDAAVFAATALHQLGIYEAAKVNAAMLLDSKVFERLNPTLSAEWSDIQITLKLASHP
ncbi:hypothetical protein G8A07_04505 [Roseateles sp. DAIF2]|uniref:hypothetical protein n=1 Tax=Roseateles sp. DAIF2 TaxID=2714952 RepID=UPI0018A2504B|nr:hypothetical protein [Roseateles sp. DAIF2]QPF72261.1 hypothetical protein G8A07_04505 [Roseateles sp. DAIF2]